MRTDNTISLSRLTTPSVPRKGVSQIEKIRIDLDAAQRTEMMQKTGRRTVPQIYIGSTHVGGFDELNALERQGKLDALLQGA